MAEACIGMLDTDSVYVCPRSPVQAFCEKYHTRNQEHGVLGEHFLKPQHACVFPGVLEKNRVWGWTQESIFPMTVFGSTHNFIIGSVPHFRVKKDDLISEIMLNIGFFDSRTRQDTSYLAYPGTRV